MSRDLFGTDGVRGLAGEYPLDEAGARAIGKAVGTQFAEAGQQIMIAGDTRESSPALVAALTAGLTAAGVNVTDVGVMPTPGLAYLTRQHDEFKAGIMVTASHNTYQYNGVKVFDEAGNKLPDEAEVGLNRLIETEVAERGDAGTVTHDDQLITQYEDFLVASAPGLQLNGLKLAIDSANGAACGLAARVFDRLGAEVVSLADKPDGRNINAECGATHIQGLQKAVTEQQLALGVALDGDADRLIMVDERGREVKGDYLLYILAVVRQTDGVVATVMSNLGFEQALHKRGIQLKRTDVGDRYVLEGLRETGFMLGGEQSGHIIFPRVLMTGDGLLAAVQTVRAVGTSGKSLAEWCDEVPLVPQALVNIPLADKSRLDQPDIQTFLSQKTEQLGDTGRVLIRPSGTEPLARVMVEAPDAEPLAKEIAAELQELLS